MALRRAAPCAARRAGVCLLMLIIYQVFDTFSAEYFARCQLSDTPADTTPPLPPPCHKTRCCRQICRMPGDAITLILRKVIDVFGRWLPDHFSPLFSLFITPIMPPLPIIFASPLLPMTPVFIPASISLILRFSFSKMSLFG
jgi:hypothetical protein